MEDIISEGKIAEFLASDPFAALIALFLLLTFILFAAAGIVLDIAYLYLKLRGKNPIGRTQVLDEARWGFWDICKAIIVFLSAQRAIFLGEIFLLSNIPYLQSNDNLSVMLSAASADIIGIAAVFYFVLNERRQDIAALGLTAKRFSANVKYGIFAYIGLIPILASVMFLTIVLFKALDIFIEPQPIVIMLEKEDHIPTLICMGLFSALLGPVIEEIFFRGFAYQALRKRFGIFSGIALSAVFFAYVHANLASFFPIFFLGMLLAYMYEKTGSLVPSMAVHIIHNSVTLAFLLLAKAVTG